MHNGKRKKPIVPSSSKSSLAASMPNGFAIAMPGVSSSLPGSNAFERLEKTSATTASPATTRQRLEGRRPSGKSRTR
jgi:hypothetical protein